MLRNRALGLATVLALLSTAAFAGSGYELYVRGKLVSGEDAKFYSEAQARNNCTWNVNQKRPTGWAITCVYDGKVFYTNQ